ncbi:nucleolar protein 7 [Manacus candei]|uniref:nucleolar protein 7 n=1 Tax=Manacus candei TaxID=415023 RepID=UPI002226AFB6|nr:nucleolar protein 7 [Manacus candei]
MAMARPRKAAAATGRRRRHAALPSPASSSEDEADEAPEQVSFGVAREAAEAERKLVGEAARRHRELLKEKRRRHQELFAEQKKRRLLPEAVLQELQELQDVAATPVPPEGPAEQAPADDQVTSSEELEDEAEKEKQVQAQGQGQAKTQVKKGKASKGARSKGNYAAVCLKDQSLTGLHQQLAKDFLNAQLYGPHTNRVQANEFFSLANKKDPVKKAAVQFVDKSWGQEKKEKAARFKKRWIATQTKN